MACCRPCCTAFCQSSAQTAQDASCMRVRLAFKYAAAAVACRGITSSEHYRSALSTAAAGPLTALQLNCSCLPPHKGSPSQPPSPCPQPRSLCGPADRPCWPPQTQPTSTAGLSGHQHKDSESFDQERLQRLCTLAGTVPRSKYSLSESCLDQIYVDTATCISGRRLIPMSIGCLCWAGRR